MNSKEKFLKAIDKNIWIEGVEELKGLERAANQCTKISIEEKIELLKSLKPKIFDGDSLWEIGIAITELTNELKQL